MIVQQQFIEQIKDHFSLNIYEIKIWTALLSRGIAAAGELSEISGVPRSRAYDVLESLERKGFIIMKVGRPIRYIAVPPEEILKRVKQTIQRDQNTQLRVLDGLKKTTVFSELETLHKQGIVKVDATELSGCISGRNNIYNFLKAEIDKAKKTVTFAATQEGYKRKMTFLRSNMNKAIKRGVKINVLTQNMNLSRESDAKVKKINHEARFVLVDDTTLVFMHLQDTKELHPSIDSAVWVKSSYFVKAVKKLIA